jgi:hypothetical protein
MTSAPSTASPVPAPQLRRNQGAQARKRVRRHQAARHEFRECSFQLAVQQAACFFEVGKKQRAVLP